MYWNYRIILHDELSDPDTHWYGLHECYYEPTGWTKTPSVFVCGKDEGPETIIKMLKMAIATLEKSDVIAEKEISTWKP